MTPDDARRALRALVEEFVELEEERAELLAIIDDERLPRVPVKGVLARIDQVQNRAFSREAYEVIEKLSHFYI